MDECLDNSRVCVFVCECIILAMRYELVMIQLITGVYIHTYMHTRVEDPFILKRSATIVTTWIHIMNSGNSDYFTNSRKTLRDPKRVGVKISQCSPAYVELNYEIQLYHNKSEKMKYGKPQSQ